MQHELACIYKGRSSFRRGAHLTGPLTVPQQKHTLVRLHRSAITLNRRIRWMRSSFGDLHGLHTVPFTVETIPHKQGPNCPEQRQSANSCLLQHSACLSVLHCVYFEHKSACAAGMCRVILALPHALEVDPKLLLRQQDAGAAFADALQRGHHGLPVADVKHRQPQLDVACTAHLPVKSNLI